jgi:hypothetical protein
LVSVLTASTALVQSIASTDLTIHSSILLGLTMVSTTDSTATTALVLHDLAEEDSVQVLSVQEADTTALQAGVMALRTTHQTRYRHQTVQ